MRKFTWSNLLILVLMVTLCACSGSDDRNDGGDPPVVRYWGAAELIENDNAGSAEKPQVAMAPDGTAIAVWGQYDGAQVSIWANRFDGGTWGTAELIENDNAGSAEKPQVAMAPDGTAIAVWRQYDGAQFSIWANWFDGGTWGTAELIENDNAGSAEKPQVAMAPDGTAIAVWRQSDGTRYNIWANRFDGGTWGTAEPIESNGGNADYPQVAMDTDGRAMAVWHQYDGTRADIWANWFNGGTWGSAELIESDNAGNAIEPKIAMSADGTAMAVWHQSDGTRYNIWANRFDGGSWGTADPIESNDGGAFDPEIAINPDGTAIAVWQQSDGTRLNIWANRFDGGTWGTGELIESNDTGDAYYPQIAINPDGDAIAVWNQYDGTRSDVWANQFDGVTWGTGELIESNDTGNTYNPQIAMNADGDAIAVWYQSDGTRYNIWANRYE